MGSGGGACPEYLRFVLPRRQTVHLAAEEAVVPGLPAFPAVEGAQDTAGGGADDHFLRVVGVDHDRMDPIAVQGSDAFPGRAGVVAPQHQAVSVEDPQHGRKHGPRAPVRCGEVPISVDPTVEFVHDHLPAVASVLAAQKRPLDGGRRHRQIQNPRCNRRSESPRRAPAPRRASGRREAR